MKKYQTQFSEPSKAVCKQLVNNGFLEEVEQVVRTRLFSQFNESMNDDELRALRDKLTAVTFITNIIREG